MLDVDDLYRIFLELGDPVPLRRRQASLRLKTIEVNEPTRLRNFIHHLIRTQPKEIDWTTLEALREIGPSRKDIPVLQIALQEASSYAVRWRAIEAIRDIDAGVRSCLREIINALGDDNYWVRWHAQQALKTIDDSSIAKILLKAIHRKHGRLRSECTLLLGHFDPPVSVARSLRRMLESDPDEVVRSAAATTLIKIAPQKSVQAFANALTDSDLNVKRNAITGLGMASQLSSRLLKALEALLVEPEQDLRANAAIVLAKHQYATIAVLATLVETLEQQPWNTSVLDALIIHLRKNPRALSCSLPRLTSSSTKKALWEAVAQGVLPTIGVKTWHQLQIEFPSRDYPWIDKGVFHSWRNHNVLDSEKPPYKANLVCINSDWFSRVHLIAVASLIMAPPEYLKMIEVPPAIEGESVGFILQSGGTLHQLAGMRQLVDWKKTNRIDFVFGDDLRTIQYLVFSGISAQIPTANRTVQETRGAEVWSVFCSGISRVLKENHLTDLIAQEWFVDVGWSSSRYRVRFERSYIDIEPYLVALVQVINSRPRLKSEVSSFVMKLLDELESVLWAEGIKKFPSPALDVLGGGQLSSC